MEDLEQEAFLAEMTADDEAPPADAQAPVVEEVVEAVPVRKEVIAGYTEEEVREALSQIGKLQKSLDTVNGTYGSRLDNQQKVIDELRQRGSTVGGLTTDKLTRLSKEFPEIAEMLASDLSEYVTQGAAPQFDPEIIERSVSTKMQLVEERIAAKERELELRALTRAHRDWRDVAAFEQSADGSIAWKNQAFGKWVDSQPAEVKTQLLNSNDADYLSDRLTEFKAIKPKVANKEVIEAAVRPRGVQGRVAADPELDEDAAYRAEMARR
jgi:hypothetical protein